MKRAKKVTRKEKPKAEKWIVVDGSGKLKYPPALGTKPEGYSKELAERLAEPVDPSHKWMAVPISSVFPETAE